MKLELINNSLSTIILDAISHYPNMKQRKECFGILLGDTSKEIYQGEFTFPIGNVSSKTSSSVNPKTTVNNMIKEMRNIVMSTDAVAFYHSHPYEDEFSDWCSPSNADCLSSEGDNTKIQMIIALAKLKNANPNRPLTLEYSTDKQMEFIGNNKKTGHDIPTEKKLDSASQFIIGHYKDYKFEVRAYEWTGKSLLDCDLYSSEVALNQLLHKEGLIHELPRLKNSYHLKKLEYSLRLDHQKKYEEKLTYLLSKLEDELGMVR